MASIVALHNTSPRRLRFASKLGGMPCPSIAYINTDHLYESFGEISLLCSPAMANPAQKDLYACDSDIYSGRFPSVKHSINWQELSGSIAYSDEIAKRFSDSASVSTRVMDFMESDSVEDMIFSIHRFPELFLQFENEVLGKDFNPDDWKQKEKRYRGGLSSNPRVQEWVNAYFERNETTHFKAGDPDIKELEAIIAEEVHELASKTAKAVTESKRPSNYMKNKDFDYFIKVFGEDYFSIVDGEKKLHLNALSNIQMDYAIWSKPSPLDLDQVHDYIKDQSDEVRMRFESWLDEKLSPAIAKSYFYHETSSGNLVKKDFTLDNVTSSMKRSMRGGEKFMYGAGNVRAQVSKKFNKWNSIEASAGILASEQDFEIEKKRLNDRFQDLIDELEPFYRFQGGNAFMKRDDIASIVSEYAGGRSISLKEGFDISDDFPVDQIDSFIRELKSAPTQYFEGKFKRSVKLGEFDVALIPEDLIENAMDIVDILKANNILIETYNPDIKGDRERRTKEVSADVGLSREVQINTNENALTK